VQKFGKILILGVINRIFSARNELDKDEIVDGRNNVEPPEENGGSGAEPRR